MFQSSFLRTGLGLLLLSILLGPAPQAAADTLLVMPGESIGEALSVAAAGDSVLVMPGTYQEEDLDLPAGILLGAFADERPVLAPIEGRASLLACQGVEGSRVEGIVFSGLDIPEYTGPERGGALLLDDAAVEFVDCLFLGLKATYGGAVHCSGRRAPRFLDCEFRDNTSLTSGGAVLAREVNGLELDGCLFVGNQAPLGGAALNLALQARARLAHCTLAENQGAGGSVAVWAAQLVEVENTIIAAGEGPAWLGDGRQPLSVVCSDVHGNAGGDWVGVLAALEGLDGNFSEPPLFCGPDNPEQPWSLNEESPCNALVNPACGQIGAFGVGCSGGVGAEPIEDGDVSLESLPLRTRLRGNHPNPFNPMTTISLDIRRPQAVTVEIFDLAGRRVSRLYSGRLEAGSHDLVWNGRNRQDEPVAAGVYFCRLHSEEVIDIQRMLLVK